VLDLFAVAAGYPDRSRGKIRPRTISGQALSKANFPRFRSAMETHPSSYKNAPKFKILLKANGFFDFFSNFLCVQPILAN